MCAGPQSMVLLRQIVGVSGAVVREVGVSILGRSGVEKQLSNLGMAVSSGRVQHEPTGFYSYLRVRPGGQQHRN